MSFQNSNLNKPKYVTNEFQYVGAQQDKEADLNLREDFSDGEGDDIDDNLNDFFARNKKNMQQKKLNLTKNL